MPNFSAFTGAGVRRSISRQTLDKPDLILCRDRAERVPYSNTLSIYREAKLLPALCFRPVPFLSSMPPIVGWADQPSQLRRSLVPIPANIILLLCACLFFVYAAFVVTYNGVQSDRVDGALIEA